MRLAERKRGEKMEGGDKMRNDFFGVVGVISCGSQADQLCCQDARYAEKFSD